MSESTPAPAAPLAPPSAIDPTGQTAANTAAAAAGDAARASALASIAELKNDRAFVAKWADRDPAARKQLSDLQQTAFGGEAQPPQISATPEPKTDGTEQPGAEAAAPAINFEFAARDLSPARALELNRHANEVVTAIGLDPVFAKGAVASLDRAVHTRGGREMDIAELASFDVKLQNLWGDQHVANCALVRAAFDKAGAHGQWLRQSILAAGPVVAAQAFAHLASNMRSRA
jgi:hypothetical protein